MFNWLKIRFLNKRGFTHKAQLDSKDCGATCLYMIASYFGLHIDIESVRQLCNTTKTGTSMLDISNAAESLGFKTLGAEISLEQLYNEVPMPCILHWKQRHFVVCYDTYRRYGDRVFKIADPAAPNNLVYSDSEISNHWCTNKDDLVGNVLLIEPGTDLNNLNSLPKESSIRDISFFFKYLKPFKKHYALIGLSMLVASVLQLIFPFLTKSLVDIGINNSNLNFITLILVSQLIISLSQIIIEFSRNWLLLHINSRINIGLVSDFLTKLMKLPLRFFESRLIGDILQRIGDHQRIEQFLTGSSLNVFFSFISFIIFGGVLGYFNYQILIIYAIGNTLYLMWVLSFMRMRRNLDIKRFYENASERSNLIQLITGMHEIKLNNCENKKRWKWEKIQIRLFNLKIKSLALGQLQHFGSLLFNQSTNILISFISARCVVSGEITLGSMISITYLVGQLNGPIGAFIGFVQQMQDAKISLERINEVNQRQDETQTNYNKFDESLPGKDIILRNVTFGYDSAFPIFKNLNLKIPGGKITAIVGESGGGKSTLLKLILGFIRPDEGSILIGDQSLSQVNPNEWRRACGAVMQDGFIFSETVAENIALCDEKPDINRLHQACEISCIGEFIDSLPMRFNSMIGMEGQGLSQGQKQRILIARVAYKNPDIILFDEATNALDSNTESNILAKLDEFFKGKTVVIIAHRLSTIRNADKIIVIKNGKVAEEGTHKSLILKEGEYYKLIQRQI